MTSRGGDGFALARTRERAGVFLALLGVAAIVVALFASLIGYLGAAATAGVRDDLSSRAGGELDLRMTLPPAADPEGQDVRVRDLLGRVFSYGPRPIPIDIDRIVVSEGSVPVIGAQRASAANVTTAAVVSVGEGFGGGSITEAAALVDGAWPESPSQVSVQADTAAALGIGAGSAISMGDLDVTVTGTWRLRDDYDGPLAANPVFSTATGADTPGPIVVDESTWPSVGANYEDQWTITPRIGELQRNDLAAIVEAWAELPSAARAEAGPDPASPHRVGRLVATAIQVQGRVDALSAIAPVALIILAVIALVTIVELARLLARLRASETALLAARGSTAVTIAGSTVAEATAAAAIGALLGMGSASAVVFAIGEALRVGGAESVADIGSALWVLSLVVVLVVAATVGGITFRSVVEDVRAEESGRLSRSGLSGAVVLIAAAAALATWQLRVYGSPVTSSRDGGSQIDPVAVLAPAALVITVSLLGFTAIAFIAASTDRRTPTMRRLRSATVVRNISRRLPQTVTPFVLCALACGQLVYAAGYSATWDRAFAVATELRAGASVRLAGSGRNLTPAALETAVAVEGVDSVAPVFLRDVVIASAESSLVAAAPQAVQRLAPEISGVLDPTSLAKAITAPSIEPRILDTSQVTLSFRTDGFAADPVVNVVLSDSNGRITRRTGTADPSVPGTSVVALSDAGIGPWTVKAVEVAVPPDVSSTVPDVNPPSFGITAITADDGSDIAVGDSWFSFDVSPGAIPLASAEDPFSPDPGDPQFDVIAGSQRMRLMPSLVQGGDRVEPPIAISVSLAERSGITVGAELPIDIEARWTTVTGVVRAILPAIPGATDDRALIMDVGVAQSILLRSYSDDVAPEVAWVGVAHPGPALADDLSAENAETDTAVTRSLRNALPARVGVESLSSDPARAILGSSKIALWTGAVGTALLALFTLLAVARSQLRARRGEVLLQRAIGVGPIEAGRLRGWELGVVLAAGSVVGGIAGAAVTLLTAAQIARSALPDLYSSLPVSVGMDVALLACAIGAFMLAVVLIVAASNRAVRAQALAGAGVEER